MTNPPLSETLRPTETLEIENSLSLVPRVKLLLTIYRADHSVKPLDEWIELNLEGVKFRLIASIPKSDDFDGMRKEWEELNAFGNRGYSRSFRTTGSNFARTTGLAVMVSAIFLFP
ncbi:hypothetical protein LOK49_LG05G02339 [Camellia lanceoleosa]|uniref:Uncharacterized protein n=1 Tax=Camellia lanceoleosa TaxID=1840588 RepID=A0ACC0HL22_9ERIC|nr:hypothetical protein LOK49_LG05G02339 [Camellia lanceoleosa]